MLIASVCVCCTAYYIISIQKKDKSMRVKRCVSPDMPGYKTGGPISYEAGQVVKALSFRIKVSTALCSVNIVSKI